MDESECLAEQYLLSLERGSVVYEPDGEKIPDFALAGTIGVEVRRLNQNYRYLDGSIKITVITSRRLRRYFYPFS